MLAHQSCQVASMAALLRENKGGKLLISARTKGNVTVLLSATTIDGEDLSCVTRGRFMA